MDAPSTSTAATTANSASAQKPKIDPLQLLKCLSILLNPRGGIRGETEVQRVKGLMAKYSKKLVSKCIYLNILQATDLPLIDLFYEEGGWELVGVWLQEAVNAKNWPLATQVLSLLESSPMTVARLKRNTTPKLVKELSKDSSSPGVQVVAKHLVLKWMEVVRQGDGVATAAGVGLDSSINTSADEDSVETPTQQAEIPTTQQAEIPTTRQAEIPTTQQAEIPNEQTSMDVDGVAEEGTHTATAESSQGEGGYGSSSLSCQDESSSTSTESDITPAPTTPIRITIRSGSQVLAKVSSQRLSQDSTDSDDNKPLSIIKQEAEKARSSTPVSGGAISNENSSTTSVGSLETGDDTSGNTTAAAAGSLEAGNAASENIESTSGSNVNSVIVNTSAVTVSSTVPSTESTTTTTTTSAIHTIVTFTGSLAANNPPVAKSLPASTQSNTTSPLPDTKDQDSPVTEKKSDMNGVSDDTKVESVTSKGANKVDSGNKSEGKSETKSEVKSEKVKKSDSSKDKAKDKHRDKDKEREKDRKSRDHDRKKDKDKSKNSKTSGSSSSSSSSSSKSDKDRVKSSKDHDRSKSDKHRSSSTKDKDRRDKDRSKSSRDKRSGSTDKDKHREKERDKDKERREDKKKKEQENEDKATLEKIKPLSADGLAKIPRKQAPASFLDALGSADVDLQEAKKPTVKTYKSRGFRNTGLLDEPTKLPGVAGKKASEKKPAAGVSLAGGMKRTSPLDDLAATPPDKRTRSSVSSLPLNADKPGGVKLISPKRPSLSDDGGFMAALTAAGTETRKKVTRKRKSSESDPKGEVKEEEGGSPSASPAKIEDKSVILSPTSVRPTFNFYQETLKDYDDEDEDAKSENDVAEKTEGSEEMEVGDTEAENEDSDKQNENQEEDVEMKNEGAEDDPRTINMDVDESEAKDEYVQPGGGEGGGDGSDGDAAGKEAEIPHAPAVPAPAQEDYEKVEVTFSLPNPSIRSVLVYHRPATRKKKAVKWKTEDDLKEVFYFELDETERVNVNSIKFNELMVMEKQREREAMGKGRALHGNMGLLGGSISSFGGMGNAGDEHMMGGLGMQHNMTNVQEFMRWSLLPVMLTGQPNISPGCRSQERVIQAARESSTMAAFFHPAMLPDSPREPDPELVVRVEPKEVPLLDISGQDNIHDHRNKLWPEPVINEPMNYGYGGMGAMGNMGGMSGGSSAGGGSHWVIGGPPSGGFAGGPMYGGPGGPGGLNGPGGYGGPGHGNFGGDMGGGMDGPSWGGPGPDFPNPNMMMGSGGPGMMMGARPNMAPRGMMSNMGMGGPRFRGRGGWGGPRSGPPACKHFMNGHCRHGKNCKFLHLKQY
ncbi:serine-rich adhesin for platelets-like isoform X1 [Procambarus clarkii]|uniref:serine-rich adhesin for platelets-like isoform X1 n=1 Tax=Procambarus clarkii TaxID=6728 RepID=UPI0037439AB6